MFLVFAQELYVAFNSISDLSPVSLLEDLELLDLEENEVEDLAQLWYLGCCVKLRTLSLEGNPVCTRPAPGASEVHLVCKIHSYSRQIADMCFVLQVSDSSFRSAVRELVPQLIFLDDVPAEEDKPQRCRASLQDWTLLRDSIKDASVSDGLQLAGKDKQQLLKTLSAALHVFKNQSLHQKRALSDLLQPGPRVSPDLSPPAPDQDQDPPAPTSPS